MSSRSRPITKSHSHTARSRIVAITLMVVLILALFIIGRHWLSMESLRTHRDALLQFVEAHYWESLSVVGVVTVAATALNVPLSPFLTVLSGMIFGLWVGTGYMILVTCLGSVLAMLVVRYLARDLARRRVRRHAKGRRILAEFERHKDSYLLFLRFSPGMPLEVANIVCGLADISVLRFSLLTLVGVIPDTFVFANIGANLAKVKSGHDLLSPGIIVALSLLAILALVPVAIERWWRRKR